MLSYKNKNFINNQSIYMVYKKVFRTRWFRKTKSSTQKIKATYLSCDVTINNDFGFNKHFINESCNIAYKFNFQAYMK